MKFSSACLRFSQPKIANSNICVPLLLGLLVVCLFASSAHAADSVRVVPGERYDAGSLHRFFGGSHWRDVWLEPITVEVLDMDNFAGGLELIRLGGGMQTNSLRFMGGNGIIYKFRSVDKDPSRALDEVLQESVVADVLQDQVSVIHPMSAIIVQELLDATEVLHAKAALYVLPDSERLGQYRERFKGMLGLVEEHPSKTEDGRIFANADKIINGYKLFDRLEKDNDEQVDPTEFLKARLMDILIGDRDRHADQWRWAGTKTGEDSWIWKPIPRDRDFAFPLYDGLIPSLMQYVIVSQAHFDHGVPPVFELTHSGRHLDRMFLAQIPKAQWDSVASYVQNAISDSVLISAVNKMPSNVYAVSGDEILTKLQSRRDSLRRTADEFYALTNRHADLFGSDKDEFLLMDRINDKEVRVELYKRQDGELAPRGPVLKSKTYHSDTTIEIRVYLRGGDDAVLVRGDVEESIRLVIDAGGGDDLLVDSSHVRGNFLYITPFSDGENLTKFYDKGKNTVLVEGPSTDFYDYKRDRSDDPVLRNEPFIWNRGYALNGYPVAGFTSDDGFTLGAGILLWRYDVFADPYDFFIGGSGSYATQSEGYDILLNGNFRQFMRNSELSVDLRATDLDIIDFYGFGNESDFNSALSDEDFYSVQQDVFRLNTELGIRLSDQSLIKTGVFLEWSDVNLDENTFADSLSPFGEGDFTAVGVNLGFEFDSRDVPIAAYEGLFLDVNMRYTSDLFSLPEDHLRLDVDVRTYFSVKFPRQTTLALRAHATKVWGEFPFYNAAQLGGNRSLRGFSRGRFVGDASLLGQAELRTDVVRSEIFVPFDFGLIGYVDSGRVFLDGESSSKWHSSVGGGLYVSVFDRIAVISLVMGTSTEQNRIYATGSMMF